MMDELTETELERLRQYDIKIPLRLRVPPKAHKPWRYRWLAAAAAIALAAGFVWYAGGKKELPSKGDAGRATDGPAKLTAKPPVSALAADATEAGTPPGMQISSASIVVRGHVAGWKGTTVQYAVDRVILGNVPEQPIQADLTAGMENLKKSFEDFARQQLRSQHPEPTDDELSAEIMRDHGICMDRAVILVLNPPPKPGMPYVQVGSWYDIPPAMPLSTPEMQIMQAIHDGSYLEFLIVNDSPAFVWGAVERSDAVVRATLLGSDDKAATWRIDKVLKGKDLPGTVVISHDVFRQRATSWVDYLAVKDATLKEPEARESRIKEEMAVMIKTELTPDRHAILFLNHLQRNQAAMVGRVYGEKLKDLEDAIIHPAPMLPHD